MGVFMVKEENQTLPVFLVKDDGVLDQVILVKTEKEEQVLAIL